MKKFLIIILTFCCSISAYTQCYYHEVFPSKTRVENEFGYVISSFKNKVFSVGVSSLQGNNTLFYLNKHDSCGDTILQKLFDFYPVGVEAPRDITQLTNGNILIQGTSYDSVEQARDNYILELDTQGQVINYKIIDAGYNDFGTGMVLNNNGITIGGIYWSDGNLFIVRTDSIGNILWSQNYDSIQGYKLTINELSIALASDSGYVLGGFMYKSNFETDYFMIKADKDGNEVWSKLYGATDTNETKGYMIATLEGGYLQVGYKVPYPEPSYFYEIHPYIIKTDSAGNIEWEKEYLTGFSNPTIIDMVVQTPDSSYIFCGTDNDTVNNVPLLLLYKTDSRGNLIWKRTYTRFGGQTHNYNSDFTISENGDIAITGYILYLNSPAPNDMFVLKVDSCGYLENDSIDAQFTYEQSNIYEISFTNQSLHYCTPLWYFGDGDSLYTNNPIHTYGDTGTYTVTLIVRAGNSLDTITQQVTVNGIVGIDDPQTPKGGLRVYPNPATQEINVQLVNLQSSIKEVKVYDVAGRMVHSQLSAVHSNITKINLGGLEEGLYFIEVTLSNGERVVKKLVRE